MNEYENYYSDQAKGIYRAPPIQRGYGQTGRGIGQMLNRFMQWITPLAKKHVLPAIESGAKYLGHNVVDSLSNVAKDTIEGKNIAEASKDRFEGLVQKIKRKVETTLDPSDDNAMENYVKKRKLDQNGEGIKSNTKRLKNSIILKPNKRTKRVEDIFDKLKI
jgi:hypothetical protein